MSQLRPGFWVRRGGNQEGSAKVRVLMLDLTSYRQTTCSDYLR